MEERFQSVFEELNGSGLPVDEEDKPGRLRELEAV